MRTVVFLVLLAVSTLSATAGAAQTAADKAAARRISSHLEQSGQLRNYRIGVTYEGGVASLTGTVASADQRDTAIRLAEQVAGVSQVDCRLQYPGHTQSPSTNEGGKVSNAFGEIKPAASQGEPAGVMQAYGHNNIENAVPAQRPTMFSRTSSRINRPRQMRRGNMPLPAPRPGMINPAIRQVSAHGVYPAGGACPDGNCGPMGPAMGYGETGGGAMMDGGAMGGGGMGMQPVPAGFVPHGAGRGPSYENAQMPGYAWPSYASYPNYAALSYPRQYSPTAWPYIGPFYPYPQVPLAWRKVALEWDDGWWFLDFSAHNSSH